MEKDSNRFGIWQKNSRANMLWSSSGWRRIRTFEGIASRFTVCPLWPLGNPSVNEFIIYKEESFCKIFFQFFWCFARQSVFEKSFPQSARPLCSIFCPNSVAVARYGAFIRTKSSTNCDARLAESFFQIRSRWMKKESITHFFCKEVDEWGKIC